MKIDQYYQTTRYEKKMIQWRKDHYYPLRLSLLINKLNLKFKGNILDAGCGDGGLAKEIAARFSTVKLYGVDISREGCRLAKKYCVETKVADLNKKIPYPNNYFDFIVSQEVLEHILDTDRYFEEFNRVLKKGGRVVITTPNLLAWYQRLLCVVGIVPTFCEMSTKDRSVGLGVLKKILHNTQPVGHIRIFTALAIKDMAKIYNFKLLALRGATIKYEFPPGLQQVYDLLDYIFSLIPYFSSNLIIYLEKK
ncbi:MAG: class I SAM-dependent methyltransferase [Candidatus Levybacteria bacterium]|nr:class I SAM-dependent methyltransferase [Candidatus Levybacteria bacterium]